MHRTVELGLGLGVLLHFCEAPGLDKADILLLRHHDTVVDGFGTELEGFLVFFLGQADFREAGEAVVGVF